MQVPAEARVAYQEAVLQLEAGEAELALEHLQVAVAKGFAPVTNVLTDPSLAQLREDPGFRLLVKKHVRESSATIVVPDEPGDPMIIRARIVDETAKPVPSAVIYFFHTDDRGIYSSVNDSKNPRLFGYLRTDEKGGLQFRSIRPAGYPGTSVPGHVHYVISAPGGPDSIGEFFLDDDTKLSEAARQSAGAGSPPRITLERDEQGTWHGEVKLLFLSSDAATNPDQDIANLAKAKEQQRLAELEQVRRAQKGDTGDRLGQPAEDMQARAVVGKPAPDFTLEDIDGQKFHLADFRGEIVVLQWTSHVCPTVNRHLHTGLLQEMMTAVDGQAKWVSVDSSHFCEEEAEKIKSWRKRNDLRQPYLLDASGAIGELYSARATTQIFIVDQGGVLAYSGAFAEPDGEMDYVVRAVSALRRGEIVNPSVTEPAGCTIKYARLLPAPKASTPDGKIYVCPPCGVDCHDKTYDAPGRCSVCQMQLIVK